MLRRHWIAARRILESESGVTAIEYSLIAMLIALVIVVGVTAIGANLSRIFNSVAVGIKT